MTAYLIGQMLVSNCEQYEVYKAMSTEIVKRFNGRFLTRGGEKVALEGEVEARRVVIVEFPSTEDGRRFYDSDAYRQARSLREGAASDIQLFLVAGFEP
ncbi:hypothetical protein AZL_a01970 (plasmid) [Azospirillum sp. B510]|uniref:DUF1330 domain-containing protein n=1 Tax=Azospirillum sp. (strain B510) TaxID=137722 RepID=UPI0001C4B993|nr:DUF1330 domain-containing protein [Azospirillum sp. B510]BAI73728.1 hypothetical protein AZL_a01970 [Azospirillum sp. B510]